MKNVFKKFIHIYCSDYSGRNAIAHIDDMVYLSYCGNLLVVVDKKKNHFYLHKNENKWGIGREFYSFIREHLEPSIKNKKDLLKFIKGTDQVTLMDLGDYSGYDPKKHGGNKK